MLKDRKSSILKFLTYGSTSLVIASVMLIVGYILVRGIPYLDPSLFSLKYNSENVSLLPALINTFFVIGISLLFAIPIGVCSAIYLSEYAKKDSLWVKILRLTTETLSGIPSIIYGLFGSLFFVIKLQLGLSILAGACTLAIMVLPLIIRTSEEAFLSLPRTYREGSFALGAGRVRTIFKILLPAALPMISSGIILAIGRIVGETAALIYTAGTVADVAKNINASGRTLSVHMYSLSTEGLYMNQAAATAVVLLLVVILMNALSSFIVKRVEVKTNGKSRN